MEKLTYVVALSTAISALSADPAMAEVVAKLSALRDQQVKRNSGERKPTAKQLENAELKEVVLSVLTAEPSTVTEIMGRDPRLSVLSNQKVSALVNALVDEGRATKVPVKRVNKFARA